MSDESVTEFIASVDADEWDRAFERETGKTVIQAQQDALWEARRAPTRPAVPGQSWGGNGLFHDWR